MMTKVPSEKLFQAVLWRKYCRSHQYMFSNTYFYNWESDFVTFLKASGYSWEIEIKRNITDFKNDFKKVKKHKTLESAKGRCPNRFYYMCPKGMLKKDDVPEYAGIMELSGIDNKSCRILKRAPLLHSRKQDVINQKLFNKLYWGYYSGQKGGEYYNILKKY